MASAELGDVGFKQSDAVSVNWQWYDYLPGIPYWIFLALVLLVLIASRRKAIRIMTAVVLVITIVAAFF